MRKLPVLTGTLLVVLTSLLSAADGGDIKDVNVIDRLDSTGPYQRI